MEAAILEENTSIKSGLETLLLIIPSLAWTGAATFSTNLLVSKCPKFIIFLTEFCVLVVPTILDITLLSSCVSNILVLICSMMILVYFISQNSKTKLSHVHSPHREYITNCRSTVNLISVVAILAVDFPIFPGRFSKTVMTGFSLMDLGVGLFVFANAIVAPEVKHKSSPFSKALTDFLILIIIGGIRLLLTIRFNYKVSPEEYGLHWNFFFTLAFVKFISWFILRVIPTKLVIIPAIIISILHETVLQMFLKEFVFFDTRRDTFLKANKEGITSLIGFIVLYLFAVNFAYRLRRVENEYKTTSNILIFYCLLNFSVMLICHFYFEVSRRLANTGYIFWILFIGFFMTLLFYMLEFKMRQARYTVLAPHLIEAINYNGLLFFAISNILTGLVNLSINTKQASVTQSLFYLIVYMLANCLFVYILYNVKWNLNSCLKSIKIRHYQSV